MCYQQVSIIIIFVIGESLPQRNHFNLKECCGKQTLNQITGVTIFTLPRHGRYADK